MKKLYYLPLLTLVSLGTWAFYPKPAAPAGYMMIISNVAGGAFSTDASIVTVAPDGSQQEKEVDFKRSSVKKVAANLTEVHKAALAQVNEYARNGWHLTAVSPTVLSSSGSTTIYQTVYTLEK